jgi:protease-4
MKASELLLLLVLVAVGIMMLFAAVLAIYALYTITYPQECVGVIEVDGEIGTKSSSGGLFGTPTIGSEDIVRQIEDAESRSEVKAVVFEVNSPGGSVVASKEIYEAARDMKKPKVSYFREVAASGGYYISAGSDYIVSEPDALTGSIGVVATFEDMSGLFNKLGVNYTILKSGELKDMGSPSRPLTDKEREIMQGIIDDIFGEFKRVVEEGRGSKLNKEKFEEVLDARILTGKQALDVGLVDQLGNRKEALKAAGRLANMSFAKEPPVCMMSSGNPIEELFSGMWDGAIYAVRSLINIDGSRRVGVSYT